ncbi:MAG: substrate-binding domain-containing protein, partial [Cyanobacteria bacterium J06553_1]
MMHANRSTLVKLCLLTALAVPVQRAASAANQQTFEGTRAKAEATQLLIAQASSEFTLPASLNDGEPLLIDGSSSMRSMNEALTAQFTERFPDAVVDSEASGTDIALQRLQDDEIELAAIGRPLTEAEKDSGLTAVNIAREKIAIFVAPNSPFDGDLTFGQFGQIFRGEITDWSDISDEAAGPIRFVDRPAFSDTRQAFQPYPVFQEAPFETGANADPVSTDETEAVIDALGEDGLGY